MEFSEDMRWAYKLKKFPEPPPKYENLPYPYRWRKPVAEDTDWRCSVYYYWWEFMRRSDRYALIYGAFSSGMSGELSMTPREMELCIDFGDVFSGDFHEWWKEKYALFAGTELLIAETVPEDDEEYTAIHQTGYLRDVKVRELFREINRNQLVSRIQIRYWQTERKYGAWGRYSLPTLQAHLDVWDAKVANPDLHDAEIADMAGITVRHGYDEAEIAQMKREGLGVKDLEQAVRRAKQLAVQRHVRITRQYIDNLMKGWFPMRSKR